MDSTSRGKPHLPILAKWQILILLLAGYTDHPVRLNGIEIDYRNDIYWDLNRQVVYASPARGLLSSSPSIPSLICVASKASRVFQNGDN